MGPESSKRDSNEGAMEKDKGFLKEAVGSLSRDEKERTEEVVDSASGRIEEASSALRDGRTKEASSTLSSGRHRDKVAGAVYKVKGWVKETSSSLTGNKEKRAEGRANQLEGVAKEKKGHLKDLFKF
jgi:uncharacterized protein YjbJ (UPF0337 family)